jgi:hypothetical protein
VGVPERLAVPSPLVKSVILKMSQYRTGIIIHCLYLFTILRNKGRALVAIVSGQVWQTYDDDIATDRRPMDYIA